MEAEAAAWVARLGYEGRVDLDDAAFRVWLNSNPRHREAFEAASTTWQLAGALKRTSVRPLQFQRFAAVPPSRRLVIGTGLAAAAGVAGLGVWAASNAGTNFVAGKGEQRRVALADGSLMTLDSGASVHVRMSPARRSIVLSTGRAHFEVAKDPMRPFVVRAANSQVVAIGTAFDVTRDDAAVTVLLVEGRVAVEPVGNGPGLGRSMMTAGDRATFLADGRVNRDRPDMAKLTAWQSGRLVFDNDTLASAVSHMNRYSRRPLVLGDPAVGQLLISGIYNAGDVEAFATSISMVLPIEVVAASSSLTLMSARPPPVPSSE